MQEQHIHIARLEQQKKKAVLLSAVTSSRSGRLLAGSCGLQVTFATEVLKAEQVRDLQRLLPYRFALPS